jgi:hypothetical protein
MPEMNPPAPEELTEWALSGGHVVKVLFGGGSGPGTGHGLGGARGDWRGAGSQSWGDSAYPIG